MAGKKIKCKDCGATVVVPTPRKKADPVRPSKKKDEDEDFLDALSSGGLEDGDEFGGDGDESESTPPPAARKKSAPKKSAPKKKKAARGSSSGGMLAKIGGGVFGALIVLGFIVRLISAVGGGKLGGVTWQEFQSPNGRYTVLFPGAGHAKPEEFPGVSTHLAETRKYACAVTYAQLPLGAGAAMSQLPPQVLSDRLMQESFPGVTPLTNRLASLAGIPAQETSFDKGGMRLTERTVIVGDELFNCEFVSKGDPPAAELNKFYDSFRITGLGGGGNVPVTNVPAPNATPAALGSPATAAGGTFQQRRQGFQTKLIKSGPAPQDFQNETPPPGVQVVTYSSGTLQLKAWVSAPKPVAGVKAPALVFFHGGFAFGADDLQACRPAMDAGMVVMAPMLRGENGNPGNYELFCGEIEDARAAVKWLAEQSYVDAQRIYTFGHSIGGGVSAVLSLMDDVPIQHGGSSGGLYTEATFAAWQPDGVVPFDMRNPEERRLRMLIGNMRDMRRKHFAYLGASDSLALFASDAKKESTGTQCQILTIPGDHFTSFEPALREYVKLIQQGQ